MKLFVPLLIVVYYALHQDIWNWRMARPLVFGFIPVGLFYHVLYTLGAAVLMALLLKIAWPAKLEDWAQKEPVE